MDERKVNAASDEPKPELPELVPPVRVPVPGLDDDDDDIGTARRGLFRSIRGK